MFEPKATAPHLNSTIRVGLTGHGDFRSTPVNGHSQDRRACLKGANAQSRCAPARCAGARTERPEAS